MMNKQIYLSLLLSLFGWKSINGNFSSCNEAYCLTTDGTTNHSHENPKNKKLCANGWLVELNSKNISMLLQQFLNENKLENSNVLLNMVEGSNSWKWNNKNEANVTITNQNDTPLRDAGCVSISSNKIEFQADDYHARHFFICSQQGQGNCSKYNSWLNNGICYFAIKNETTWFGANMACIKFNAVLAVFENINLIQLNASLISSFFLSNETKYWIGLSNNTWTWNYSGQFVTYNNWAEGHPKNDSSDCVFANSSSQWKTSSCNASYLIVCMSAAQTSAISTQIILQTQSTSPNGYLSRDAKIGIGVGVGVGGLLILILIISAIFLVMFKKSKTDKRMKEEGEPTVQEVFNDPQQEPNVSSDRQYALVVPGGNKGNQDQEYQPLGGISYADLQLQNSESDYYNGDGANARK